MSTWVNPKITPFIAVDSSKQPQDIPVNPRLSPGSLGYLEATHVYSDGS